MNYFFSYANLSKSLKNLLIFFPILISNIQIEFEHILKLVLGFIIFFVITNCVYIVNDFIDKSKDRRNILKTKNLGHNISKNNFYITNFFLFIFFLAILKTNLSNIYLICYLVNFYLYSFFFKKIKYYDIFFLNLFYILRLLYGAELVKIDISYWFIIFFSTLFLSLSIFKRYIQVYQNKLINKNKIIPYNLNDIFLFKKLIIFFMIINFLVIFFYFTQDYFFLRFMSSSHTYIFISLEIKVLIFLYYLINYIRIFFLLINNKIKEDIFQFVAKDKFILFSTITLILIIISFI
jgi:4-hydroxybenzoate polyprenyltransferase